MKTATQLPNEAKSPRSLISDRRERLHFFISEASSLAPQGATSLKKPRLREVFSVAPLQTGPGVPKKLYLAACNCTIWIAFRFVIVRFGSYKIKKQSELFINSLRLMSSILRKSESGRR